MKGYEDRIFFVILHYLTLDDTIQCIESIQGLKGGRDINIIVVDNNSPNNSGVIIKDMYISDEKIEVILLEKNEGFAKGNNIGYHIAKKRDADYIIVINNDIIIKQKDFIEKIIEKYNQNKYHILGPDIINLDGTHQNPHRNSGFTIQDVRRIIRNRTIILFYLKMIKFFHCTDRIRLLTLLEQIHCNAEQQNLMWNKEQEDVVLQGAAYIFSRDYIKENDNAFCPETFMYLEEELLFYMAHKKGYIIRYCPDIGVVHKWQQATSQVMHTDYEKSRMQTEWLLDSAKIMKKILKRKICESI